MQENNFIDGKICLYPQEWNVILNVPVEVKRDVLQDVAVTKTCQVTRLTSKMITTWKSAMYLWGSQYMLNRC